VVVIARPVVRRFSLPAALEEPEVAGHFAGEHQVPTVTRLPDGRAEEHLYLEAPRRLGPSPGTSGGDRCF